MLQLLKTLIPVRYAALGLGLCSLLLALASVALWGGGWLVVLVCACVVALGIRDLRQRQHAIFPRPALAGLPARQGRTRQPAVWHAARRGLAGL